MSNNAIGSAVVSAIADAVGRAVVKSANDPAAPGVTSAGPSTVATVQENVAREVLKSPELQHVTNQEPWYKKRSRWASIIGPVFGVLVPVAAVYGFNIPVGTEAMVVAGLTAAGTAWAGYLSYRAGTATKPLFE